MFTVRCLQWRVRQVKVIFNYRSGHLGLERHRYSKPCVLKTRNVQNLIKKKIPGKQWRTVLPSNMVSASLYLHPTVSGFPTEAVGLFQQGSWRKAAGMSPQYPCKRHSKLPHKFSYQVLEVWRFLIHVSLQRNNSAPAWEVLWWNVSQWLVCLAFNTTNTTKQTEHSPLQTKKKPITRHQTYNEYWHWYLILVIVAMLVSEDRCTSWVNKSTCPSPFFCTYLSRDLSKARCPSSLCSPDTRWALADFRC